MLHGYAPVAHMLENTFWRIDNIFVNFNTYIKD